MKNDEVTKQLPGFSDTVVVFRHPDNYTLIGSPMRLFNIEEAAGYLAISGWMREWVKGKITEALRRGEILRSYKEVTPGWRGRPDGMVSEWRCATPEEVLDFAVIEKRAAISGRSASKRFLEKKYTLCYRKDDALIEKYDTLPRQARTILDLLNDAKRVQFTEAAVEVLLNEHADLLKTKQDPMKIFGFYRRRLINEGHLEEDA